MVAEPGPVGPLRFIAWVVLAVSIILSLSVLAQAEGGSGIAVVRGLAAVVQGLAAWAFLMVFAAVSENVAVAAEAIHDLERKERARKGPESPGSS